VYLNAHKATIIRMVCAHYVLAHAYNAQEDLSTIVRVADLAITTSIIDVSKIVLRDSTKTMNQFHVGPVHKLVQAAYSSQFAYHVRRAIH
jgi:ABC-type iron transport system FetAB permease component